MNTLQQIRAIRPHLVPISVDEYFVLITIVVHRNDIYYYYQQWVSPTLVGSTL